MPILRDLEPFNVSSSKKNPQVQSVGWLGKNLPFPTGDVDRDFFWRLFELLQDPWQPALSMGFHDCGLCQFTGGPKSIRFKDSQITVGNSKLYVPSGDYLFVAPSLIVHYIDSHGYCPPDVFQEAVLECPKMRSMDYLRAIRRHDGIHAFT